MLPLFENYPTLKKNLPYISLGELPTPINKLSYGGNKVRK